MNLNEFFINNIVVIDEEKGKYHKSIRLKVLL